MEMPRKGKQPKILIQSIVVTKMWKIIEGNVQHNKSMNIRTRIVMMTVKNEWVITYNVHT